MGKNKRKIYRTKRVFVQKKYRDALFRKIFNERSVLLELYNALNNTTYTDEKELTVYTIDDVIYLGYKNDISFIVRGTLNLYEHQSTLNPNMPLRGLIYFGKQYESYIKQHNLNIYGKKQLKIPSPQFVIFYNGIAPLGNDADCTELHLSDAFELMFRCRTLEEYSILISRITSKVLEGLSLEQAIDFTVQDCIHDNILRDFLIKHRSEVVGMLLEEFDMEEYIKMERRDSYEDGKLQGECQYRIHVIHTMYQKDIPAESCIAMLDEDADFVNHIYQLCQLHPDWSDSKLFEAVENN